MKPRLICFHYILLLHSHPSAKAELLSDCPPSTPPPANASASYSVRPFNSSGPSSTPLSISNWTFGTTISEETISDQQYVTQTFFVSTNPSVDISSGDLPYTGGVAFVNELTQLVSKATINDPGDCSTIFSHACITALTKSATSTALRYSGKPASSSSPLLLLANSLPSECVQFAPSNAKWSIPISTRTYPKQNLSPTKQS